MKQILIFTILILLFGNLNYSQTETKWETIYTFAGSSNENTDDFVITANKWRIVWKAEKQYEEVYGGNVVIKLVDINGDEDMIANTIPNDSGKTIIRKSGRFYFDVFSSLAKWKIKVQVSK